MRRGIGGIPGATLSSLVAVCTLALPVCAGAQSLVPVSVDLGPARLSLRGSADGAFFVADRNAQRAGATGELRLSPVLERDYDSGMVLSLQASILAAHDDLAVDRYGNDVFEKVYGAVQTGLGRLEIGQTDGAAYTMAMTGPKVDAEFSTDDPTMSLFRDPRTGRAVLNAFALRSAIGASSNNAKFSYYTPRLFGWQIGASFTPSQGKAVLPFLDAGPDTANRQNRIWETALSYRGDVGPATLTASAALAMGHAERRTAGHEGLTDWGVGLDADYPINEDVTLSAGGAYRRTNAYAFDTADVESAGLTQALVLRKPCIFRRRCAGTCGRSDLSIRAARRMHRPACRGLARWGLKLPLPTASAPMSISWAAGSALTMCATPAASTMARAASF